MEKKKMEQEVIVDEQTGLVSNYVQLEKGKKKVIRITNWRTVKDHNEKENKDYINWKADVLAEGEQKELLNVLLPMKEFKTSHVDFRKKVNDILFGKDKNTQVLIGVKIVDDTKKPIIYDVELL